ncbi:MAG: putative bifunctional diguanylate cyclase/phosphodiesterase [Halothiobacillaceae bacterium]
MDELNPLTWPIPIWIGIVLTLLVVLGGVVYRLRRFRHDLHSLLQDDSSASPRPLKESLTHLEAIVRTHRTLIDQTHRTRDELRSSTQAKEQLRRQQWAAQQLFARLDEGVIMADHGGQVFEVNPALEHMLQRPAHLLRERKLHEVLVAEDEALLAQLCANIVRIGHWEGRIVLHRGDRTSFPAFLRLLSLLDEHGKPRYLLAVLQDLTPTEQTQAQLHQLTHHDPLTGLQNRASFLDEVDAILRTGQPQSWVFAILGIDRFAMVSDTLGPTLAGRILHLLGQRLQQAMGPHERLAFLGGNEFAWFAPLAADNERSETLIKRPQRLLDLLRQPVELKEPHYTLKLTASLGMATHPSDGRCADDLLQAAHLALLYAQHEGGDRAALHNEAMRQQALRRFQIEQGLRSALEKREIECYLHPLVYAQTGQLAGFEALMRWRHSDGRFTSPAEFIPVAEETGIIIPLTQWVLDQACQHLYSWRQRSGRPLFISLNVSPRQLLDPKLAESLIKTLRKYRLDPTAVTLEITESGLVGSIDLVRERILQLAMHGFLIAIDDFGTGHSTLSLLNELPIDKLKIDQSFIRDRIPHDTEAVKIVEAMLALAKGLELSVVIEGVETAEQADFLRQRLPTALLQGFLFAPPQALYAWDGVLLDGQLPDFDWNKEKRGA